MRLRAARLRLVTRGTRGREDPTSPPSMSGEWEALERLVFQEIAETGNTQISTFILLQKRTGNYEDPRRILTEELGDCGVRGSFLAYFILAGA